ncbi:MAG TPA: ATP-binding cassette domain-containing protein, partial [Candidatus Saccharimonadales bacterium]
MKTAIGINDLSVVIDKKQILSHITATVPEGKIVGLLGPSGSGKTTLIRTILGLQKSSAGSVEVLGMKAGSKSLKAKIGYMAQTPSVYADLTVGENVRYFADLVGASKH